MRATVFSGSDETETCRKIRISASDIIEDVLINRRFIKFVNDFLELL